MTPNSCSRTQIGWRTCSLRSTGERVGCARAGFWRCCSLGQLRGAPALGRTSWRQELSGLVGRLEDRSRVERFFAHPGVLESLQNADNVIPAGAHAPRDQGERLLPGREVDAYVAEADVSELVRDFALEPSDQPNAIVRSLPDGLWPFVGRRMPLAAVAVDLAALPDARSRRIGHKLIKRLSNG